MSIRTALATAVSLAILGGTTTLAAPVTSSLDDCALFGAVIAHLGHGAHLTPSDASDDPPDTTPAESRARQLRALLPVLSEAEARELGASSFAAEGVGYQVRCAASAARGASFTNDILFLRPMKTRDGNTAVVMATPFEPGEFQSQMCLMRRRAGAWTVQTCRILAPDRGR